MYPDYIHNDSCNALSTPNALDKTHDNFIIKTSVSNYCEYMFYQ